MLRILGHFTEDTKIRIALHITQHLAFLEKNSPLLTRIAILALGDGGDRGLHNVPAADHNRDSGIHVRNDMAQSAVHSLLRSIKGQCADTSRGIADVQPQSPYLVITVIRGLQPGCMLLAGAFVHDGQGFT
ncbi:hypothetical protein D3C80_1595030 [compost metagenome]